MREYTITWRDPNRPVQIILADRWRIEDDVYATYITSKAGVDERRTFPRSEVLYIDPPSPGWGPGR